MSFSPTMTNAAVSRLRPRSASQARVGQVFPAHYPVFEDQGDGSVVASCSCSKGRDCQSIGKHPIRKGWQDKATTDEETIKTWWSESKPYNVGVCPVGQQFFLDVDQIRDMEILEGQFEPLPEGPLFHTGGGGEHRAFLAPAGRVPGNKVRVRVNGHELKIDVRSQGGLIIGPGSIHQSGKCYEEDDHLPIDTPIPEAPEWLLQALNGVNGGHHEVPDGPISEGSRNSSLFTLALKLARDGLKKPEIADALKAKNSRSCQPPLGEAEVERIAHSATQHDTRHRSTEEWPEAEPLPLHREVPDAAPFPVDALGDVLGPACQDIIDIIKPPDATAASSILAAAALAVQGYVDVQIDGRFLPASLFLMSVLESGGRKSSVDKAALAPHNAHEKARHEEYKIEYEQYEIELTAWKKARDKAVGGSKKVPRADLVKALEAVGSAPEEPMKPQLTMQEPTYEGLIKLLLRGRPSVGLFTDEGGQFIGGFAMSKDNRLKTISGLSALWSDGEAKRTRAGDGFENLYGRRVSMHLMVQPPVAEMLIGDPVAQGQGFLSRCLTSWPTPTIGYQAYVEENVLQRDGYRRYYRRMTQLLEAPLPTEEGDKHVLRPRALNLSSDAKREWIAFHDSIQEGLKCDLRPISAFAAKLPEQALRIAAVLTVVDQADAGAIDLAHIERAIEIARFYLSEAVRLNGLSATDPDLILAAKLLKWMRERSPLVPVVHIYQFGPNAVRDKATTERLLMILEQHGWVRRAKGGAEIAGRRYEKVWEVRNDE